MQNRKRFLSLLLAVVILAGSAAAMAAFVIPSARDLMVQAIETTQTITDAHAVAEFEVDTPQMSASGAMEVWGQLEYGPNGEPAFRVEILEADKPEMVGVTAVADGTQFWVYSPAENKVLVGTFEELAAKMAERAEEFDFEEFAPEGFDPEAFDHEAIDKPETPEEAVDKLLEYVTADRTGTEDIGDNRVFTVRLVPIPEQMPEEVRLAGGYLNVWIRGVDSALIGVEYAEGVPGTARALASTLDINQGIDPAVFTFDIPEGAELLTLDDLEAMMPADFAAAAAPIDFEVLTPSVLPDGAAAAESSEIRGAVVQRYDLTDGDFYVAQGPSAAVAGLFGSEAGDSVTVRGVDGALYSEGDGGRVLLTWIENGVTYWIGGNISAADALAVAESLE